MGAPEWALLNLVREEQANPFYHFQVVLHQMEAFSPELSIPLALLWSATFLKM